MQKLPACPLHCTLSPCKRLTLTSSNRRASMKLDRKLSTMQGIASISASTIGEFMIDQNDYNRRVIEEFRADRGKPGGRWEGRPLLLLTTTGARSGQPRTTPMMYIPDGDRLLVIASNAGAPAHPDWYRNLVGRCASVGGDHEQAVAIGD